MPPDTNMQPPRITLDMVIGDPETLRRKARPGFGVGASVARSSTTAVRLPVVLSINEVVPVGWTGRRPE
jgi:hypothetical protein